MIYLSFLPHPYPPLLRWSPSSHLSATCLPACCRLCADRWSWGKMSKDVVGRRGMEKRQKRTRKEEEKTPILSTPPPGPIATTITTIYAPRSLTWGNQNNNNNNSSSNNNNHHGLTDWPTRPTDRYSPPRPPPSLWSPRPPVVFQVSRRTCI